MRPPPTLFECICRRRSLAPTTIADSSRKCNRSRRSMFSMNVRAASHNYISSISIGIPTWLVFLVLPWNCRYIAYCIMLIRIMLFREHLRLDSEIARFAHVKNNDEFLPWANVRYRSREDRENHRSSGTRQGYSDTLCPHEQSVQPGFRSGDSTYAHVHTSLACLRR